MKAKLAILVALALVGCSAPQAPAVDPRPPGIEAKPAELAFQCVTPGCDSTVTTTVTVVGSRRVAIKRIVVQGPPDGFSLKSSDEPPFIVGAGANFTVDVRYAPTNAPDPGDVQLAIDYTDASPDQNADRLPAGRLLIPLVRRLVGEPVLATTPGALSFGVVAPGQQQTLPVQLQNVGFGNVALQISAVDAGAPDVTTTLDNPALAPDSGATLQVTYAPTAEGYLRSQITITSSTPDVAPVTIPVEGTSLRVAHLAIDPTPALDFGQVPVGQNKVLSRQVVNQGGQPLHLAAMQVTDATGRVTASLGNGDGGMVTLAPLERVPLEVTLQGTTPGDVAAQLTILSDDPALSQLDLPVAGTVTEPQVALSPASVDFGSVPVGWVVHQPFEIRNDGYGPLTVKTIQLVGGSSSLFTLAQVPGLPATLQRDQRFGLDIAFSAAAAATFSGTLSVETDDPQNPFAVVPLNATGGACGTSCPIANGTPTCTSGSCAIGSCNTGWYDTDQAASNGCECKEIGNDPGEFCDSSVYAGNLKDTDSAHANHTGILPVDGDVDVIRFFAEDGNDIGFSDSFDVRVSLSSSDPNIKMCVYHHENGSHQTSCEWTDETCPQNNSYEKDGSWGSGDDADFIVKVYRVDGAAPTCTPYTVFMSNG